MILCHKHKVNIEQQRDSNTQPLSSKTNTQPFSQTGQKIELRCEHLSLRCIWLYVTYEFRVNPHSLVSLNVRELLPQSSCDVWSSNQINGTRTHNHLVHKGTLNHLAKLAKRLNCVVTTYLYGAFDRMLLSYHVRDSEWIRIL